MITEEPTPSQLVRAGRELERLKAIENQKARYRRYLQRAIQDDIPGLKLELRALRGEPGYVRPPREQGPEMPYPSSLLADAPIQGQLFTTETTYTPTFDQQTANAVAEKVAAARQSQTPSGRRFAALNNVRSIATLAALLGGGVGTAAYLSPDF